MALTDLPVLGMLRTRMQWAQARQGLIAENVANADTPNFRPKDLKPPVAPGEAGVGTGALAMAQTSPLHLAAAGAGRAEDSQNAARFETRPSGNGVNLETEMVKAADNQADYQLAASLYQKSLAMLRTAAGAKA